MKPRMLAAAALLIMPAARAIGFPQEIQANAAGLVHTEIPYRDGIVKLTSDRQEEISGNRFRAQGRVVIAFKDVVITAEAAEYNKETG